MTNMLKNRAKDPTHAVFGVTPEGEVFDRPLSSGPHWLICGQTGSGKSVFVNNLLISAMSHSHPDELQITWVDPKKVEAGPYVGLPFCPIDPVTNMNDAYGLMAFYVDEMERRYGVMEEHGFKQVADMNAWIDDNPKDAKAKGLEKMPYMLCVIDEYADLQQQAPDTEKLIARLGAKARASAQHVICVTQRPWIQVISGLLKANLPSRVALKVADGTNSQIIMDETGAEKLRGYGDAFVKEVSGEITRMQGPFIPDDQLHAIFKQLREKYPKPESIDYKQRAVDSGMCEWEEAYEDDVPWKDRHVKPVKQKRR